MYKFWALCLVCLSVLVPAQAAELSAQDYAEIQQLYARYNFAIDGGDAEAWAATFTPDGVFNTFAGHEALVGFVKNWRANMHGGARRHWNSNLSIAGNSQTATGSVYLLLVDTSTKPVSIAFSGTYSDTLVKTKQGWRFSKRTVAADTPADAATPPPKGD